jgi:hypothetical protein
LIENIGVDHLSKAQWKKLDVIYLSENNNSIDFNRIGKGGIGSLSKMYRAPALLELYLSTSILIQMITN